jgi:serine/threonine protein kinase
MPIPNPLGPYRIERLLGKGGFADVYLAVDARRGHAVALKILLPQHAGGEPLERFRREGQQMLSLRHQCIVAAYDVGEIGGYHTIAMPYMAHGSLADLLKRQGRLDLATATRIIEQVAAALDFVHPQIIHRDLKPSNILFDPAGNACVADFGVAHIAGEVTLTATGAQIGTPQYMAPEQVRPQLYGSASPATDTWALGVMLYEMLTGQRPFNADDPLGVLLQVINDQPTRPAALNPALPAELDRVIGRALAKDPRQRYPRAGDLANDLRRLAGPAPQVAQMPLQRNSGRPVTPAGGRPGMPPKSQTSAEGPQGHGPWLWPSLGAAALLVGLTAAFVFQPWKPQALAPTPTENVAASALTSTGSAISNTEPLLAVASSTVKPDSTTPGTPGAVLSDTRKTVATRVITPTVTSTKAASAQSATPTARLPGGATLSAPILDAPGDGDTPSNARVTFQWQAVAGARGYRLELRSDRPGQTDWYALVEQMLGTEIPIRYDDRPDYFTIPGTVYYWRVKSLDADGNGNYSQERRFVFNRPAAPEEPKAALPVLPPPK